ncbi:MAG: hypothetical protein ACRCYO_19775 [Bacteroidia bacterium]
MSQTPKVFILLFLFIFSATCLSAQQDTFRVKTVATVITVLPELSMLYVEEDNWVKISYQGKYKLGKVELRGGTATQTDSMWSLKPASGVEAILVIHEILKNGSQRVAFTKKYKLFARERPIVYLDGIPNDSATDKLTVIALGHLQARTKYSKQSWPIVSFKLYISVNGKLDTLAAQGDRLTPEMKQKIDALNVRGKGGVLIFDDIKCVAPDGKTVTLKGIRIYLFDDKKTKAGT